jgi:hypothetical protein
MRSIHDSVTASTVLDSDDEVVARSRTTMSTTTVSSSQWSSSSCQESSACSTDAAVDEYYDRSYGRSTRQQSCSSADHWTAAPSDAMNVSSDASIIDNEDDSVRLSTAEACLCRCLDTFESGCGIPYLYARCRK